jgi:DNA replication protein DnaC
MKVTTALRTLKQSLSTLHLREAAGIVEELLLTAEKQQWSFREFAQRLLDHEGKCREAKQLAKRFKSAAFPEIKTLAEFKPEESDTLSKKQLAQLQELVWLEQAYHILLLGPPGVGKTHLAIGLGVEALQKGFKVSFVTMDTLIQLLKTQEISRQAQLKMKRIFESGLIIIDDLMFMAMDRNEANLFFQFINKVYGQSSLIITSNKGPSDWGELLGDVAITTAILDRIIHKSEVIQLTGDSNRLKHRKTIFGDLVTHN